MSLISLKNWINNLPKEFDNFDIVVSTIGDLEDGLSYRKDVPIMTLSVDEQTKEILFIINDEKITTTIDENIEKN